MLRPSRAEAAVADRCGGIVRGNAKGQEYALHKLVARPQVERFFGADSRQNVALVGGEVIVQLCYPVSFLSHGSGAFAL